MTIRLIEGQQYTFLLAWLGGRNIAIHRRDLRRRKRTLDRDSWSTGRREVVNPKEIEKPKRTHAGRLNDPLRQTRLKETRLQNSHGCERAGDMRLLDDKGKKSVDSVLFAISRRMFMLK